MKITCRRHHLRGAGYDLSGKTSKPDSVRCKIIRIQTTSNFPQRLTISLITTARGVSGWAHIPGRGLHAFVGAASLGYAAGIRAANASNLILSESAKGGSHQSGRGAGNEGRETHGGSEGFELNCGEVSCLCNCCCY